MMTIKGITPEEEIVIKSILAPYLNKYEFYFYGSRVKGDYRFLSDLDIMVKGEKTADINDIETIKDELDKSILPYVVNFADYYSLDEKFYQLIKNDLVKL